VCVTFARAGYVYATVYLQAGDAPVVAWREVDRPGAGDCRLGRAVRQLAQWLRQADLRDYVGACAALRAKLRDLEAELNQAGSDTYAPLTPTAPDTLAAGPAGPAGGSQAPCGQPGAGSAPGG
jgi:hypothetical protein